MVQKVSMENTKKEMYLLQLEKEKTDRVINQWKTEKQHMIDTLLTTSHEMDEMLRDKEDLEKYVMCMLCCYNYIFDVMLY